ncbi:alpha/beta hydrolase [Arthrobacter sp. UYEF21]|uniref:alpha/beta hydrolase n=1 Tax=Arthrobacter sp. UYEF21 TaxID=1756364 RepID=UPI0033935BFF
MIAKLVGSSGGPALSADTLAERRAAGTTRDVPLALFVERNDYPIPGAVGVQVRVHRPQGVDGPLPCVYSIHGGWYVLGSFDMDDDRLSRWARRYHLIGVSVDYRRSPEVPYPGPLEDCYAGLRWVFDHHEELGVDPNNIGVAGSSAGAGLAAALALLARDRGEFPLKFQVLDAPMIDDRQLTPSSQMGGLVVHDPHTSEYGWRSYLGDLYGNADIPPYAAAARAKDLSGLPPAYIAVGNVDGFRDEAIDYATRLNQAGVPAELHVHAGAPHGVKGFIDTPVALRYSRGIDDWVGQRVRPEA